MKKPKPKSRTPNVQSHAMRRLGERVAANKALIDKVTKRGGRKK
jgi:hypothetical protein